MPVLREFVSWLRNDEDFWHRHLAESQQFSWVIRVSRRVWRATPSDPRCKTCCAPFGTIGGRLFSLVGRGQSRKNPRFCKGCFEHAPMGGVEAQIGVLFADVRGFTAFSETRSPEEAARLLNRFYAVATDVLSHRDAVIDKLIGDEVMVLFVPAFAGERCIEKMVLAAEALLLGMGYGSGEEPWLPLGIGMDFGAAFVGNVGAGEVKDFTAIGDVVNTAARLQTEAKPGQMVMSERVYQAVSERYPESAAVALTLKGKSEPVSARIVTPGQPRMAS